MSCHIGECLRQIMRPRYHPSFAYDNSPYRHLTFIIGSGRFIERHLHIAYVIGGNIHQRRISCSLNKVG